MAFTPEQLLGALAALPPQAPVWVAFSGGLDSRVLLQACSELRGRLPGLAALRALHVNHGINPRAQDWQTHCQAVCAALQLPLDLRQARLADSGESLETRARKARYAIFRELLSGGGSLLLAHHQDDQAETLLFRLLRGAGTRGLAGMPACRRLGAGQLLRPLLEQPRAALEDYARRSGLQWIEDDSNAELAHDRNFLRHDILPRLASRWPGYRSAFARSARLCAEAEVLLDDLAGRDLDGCRDALPWRLRLSGLQALSAARQRTALRRWFAELEASRGFPPPGHHALAQISDELLPARADAAPVVAWEGRGGRGEAGRHGGFLQVRRPLPAAPDSGVRHWDLRAPLVLGAGLGALHLLPARQGLDPRRLQTLELRFRQGGETLRPAGRRSRSLKKFLQEAGVPSWERDLLPLLYHGDSLVAVADLCLCEGWQETRKEGLYRVHWERPDPL